MKRSGFTMIELIFVIVILGILAAVAIPKLAATRDDATIAKMATNAATLVSDYGAAYTAAPAGFDANQTWTNVTGVATETAAGTPTATTTALTTAVLLTDGTNTCVTFTPSQSVAGGQYDRLTVTTGTTGTVCTAVAAKVASITKAHTFGGTGVQ